MPIFSIQAPDGKTYRVQGPDQAGAIEYLQSQIEGNKSTQPNQPNYNPPGTGVGRGFKRGFKRTGQSFDLGKATIAANTLRGMDVDALETLKRSLGVHVGTKHPDALQSILKNDLQDLQYQDPDRFFRRIVSNYGLKPEIADRLIADFQRIEAGKEEMREPGGYFDQTEQAGVEALEAAQKKQQEIEALPMSPTAQTGAQDFQDAEGVLDWAKSSFKNPLGALAFIGEIAAESTPSIAAGIGTSILTGNPVAGAGVMILSGAPQTFSGEFVDFLREKGIDLSNAEEIGEALRNDDILSEAFSRGIEASAIIGFFEALGMKAGGGILRQTFAQSASGAGGEGAKSYVLDGKIVPKDMALEAVAETATVPGEVAIMKGRSLFTSDGKIQPDYNDLSATEKQAGADVARLLREISATNGYNLRDTNVASEKGGKKALEAARKRIIDRLRELKKDAAIKPLLSPKQRKSLDQLLDDFAPADGAFRAANNKVSDRVTQDQYDAVMRLLPDSKEKQEIANLLRMSNQVTDLFNKGLKGGISQYTDYFNPFIKDGSYDPNRAANVIIGTGAGLTLGPVTTTGIVAGGRTFDFVTGRRAAAVDRFVRSNEKKPGLDAPSGNSLIQAQADAEAAAQQRADQEVADAETARFNRRQMNLELTQRNAAPTPDSPQAIMEDATGLDRSGVARVLRIIEATADNPAILDAIASYRKSIAQGGKVKDLSPLIRMVNERVANNPGLVERVREPNNSLQPNVDPTGPAQPRADAEFGNQRTTPENYNRGIEDNKVFRQSLEDRVLKNPDIKGDEELRLLTSLSYLRDNLGTSPVPRALQEIQDLEDSGVVSQENIDTYVKPYVNRIVKQQKRNAPEQPTVQTDEEIQAEAEQFGEDLKALFKGNEPKAARRPQTSLIYGRSEGENYLFDTTPDLSNELADAVESKLTGLNLKDVEISTSTSNVSPSSYVNVSFVELDEDGDVVDTLDEFKLRFSDHADRYGSNETIRFDDKIEDIEEDGDYVETSIPSWQFEEMVNKGVSLIQDATKAQELMQTETATGPVLSQTPNPLNIDTNDLAATNLNEMPSADDIAQMREGDYKPESKRTLVEAVDYLNNKWQKATGRTEPFEYTPENVDRIASLMATEAMQALKNDGNAIGWYDRKLKAAKSVVSLVEPRVTQSPDAEAAFDFALAVTSNGQAVADNFDYALEVFRHFMDNGVMPTDTWIKGGERNKAMIEAFSFFNAYNASGTNMPIQDFLDGDYTVRDLKEWASGFNERNGTKIKVPSSEGQSEMVKGSYIIGPKIGQGFYQNIRGNYDPLTMDIWWMRMWNRLVGRPFTTQTAKAANTGRQRVKEGLKTKNQGALEKRLTNESLKKLGLTRASLKDQDTFDEFVIELEANYQRFFSKRGKELKGTKQKVEKPELFLATGSLVKNITPQLQGQPKGPGERSYMRTVTKAAIEKLRQNGYMIDTADFQALMWYPEKQLFRKLGVAPGRGADNDYLDAAKIQAAKEGFTDDQINQALPPSDGDGAVNNQPNTPGQDGPGNPRANRVGPAQQTGVAAALAERIQGSDRRSPPTRGAVPSQQEVIQSGQAIKAVLEIGKPGSRYEDGLRTLDDVRRLADVINVSLELFSNQEAIDAAFETAGGKGGQVAGFFMRNETTQRGRAAVLDEGAVDVLGKTTSEFDVYITALHEVLHGLADQQYHPAILNKFGTKAEGITRPLQKIGKNPLTGRIEIAGHGSFEQFVARLVTNNTQVPKQVRNKVLKEIKDMQAKADFRPVGFSDTNNRSSVRERVGIAVDPNYKKYVRGAPEMAVDPLIFYMNNPKQMKKDYPETAKAIKGFFQYSTRVQFFTHPLAMAMAVVMAIMAKQDEAADEEERRRMMPPPGALNQPMQPGALSA
jgi:hypothetical protein